MSDDYARLFNARGRQYDGAMTRYPQARAADRLALADFCRLLFGLDGIGAAGLAPLLASEVGFRDGDSGVELDWELVFYRALRR